MTDRELVNGRFTMCIMFFLFWRHHEPSGLHLWENSSTCKRILSRSSHPWTATHCQSKIGNLWKVSFVECPWWIFLFWSDEIWIFHHTRLNQGVIFWVWILLCFLIKTIQEISCLVCVTCIQKLPILLALLFTDFQNWLVK